MNLYIYSDESGVLDVIHNQYFVFAGLILLGTKEKNICSRKYSRAEKTVKKKNEFASDYEAKATNIGNSDKNSLFRSLNQFNKFSVVIRQEEIAKEIFDCKKAKQRYLDYVYKIAVKRALEDLMRRKVFHESDIENIYIYVDEHSTATNGCYELREAMENEFKNGTFNENWNHFFPPIFPNMGVVQLCYCNSEKKLLVRGADIIANNVYHKAIKQEEIKCTKLHNIYCGKSISHY